MILLIPKSKINPITIKKKLINTKSTDILNSALSALGFDRGLSQVTSKIRKIRIKKKKKNDNLNINIYI